MAIVKDYKRLSDMPISGFVVSDVRGSDNTDIAIDIIPDVDKNSIACVKSSGIYTAMERLSAAAIDKAREYDMSLDSQLTKTGQNPVSSQEIWTFADWFNV